MGLVQIKTSVLWKKKWGNWVSMENLKKKKHTHANISIFPISFLVPDWYTGPFIPGINNSTGGSQWFLLSRTTQRFKTKVKRERSHHMADFPHRCLSSCIHFHPEKTSTHTVSPRWRFNFRYFTHGADTRNGNSTLHVDADYTIQMLSLLHLNTVQRQALTGM